MTVGELFFFLLRHQDPRAQDGYDLTSDDVALVDTDQLGELWSLQDVEEVHLGLAAKRNIYYHVVVPFPRMVPLVGAAPVQPMPQVMGQHLQGAAMFVQPVPQPLAQHPSNVAAVQPWAHAVPQHLQQPAVQPHLQAPLQQTDMNTEAPSQEEIQALMQQRLTRSLQRNRAVYFQ